MKSDSAGTDASGNRRLDDIGFFLRDELNHFFQSRNIPITLKYIVPSYAIRSVPASPQDNVYCSILAQNAVHAGMAGKTNMMVGRWHDTFVHIPLNLVIGGRQKIEPEGEHTGDLCWRVPGSRFECSELFSLMHSSNQLDALTSSVATTRSYLFQFSRKWVGDSPVNLRKMRLKCVKD